MPLTITYIVGMLDSSAHLDTRGSERRQVEANDSGKATGQEIKLHGKSCQVVELPPNSYSLGITGYHAFGPNPCGTGGGSSPQVRIRVRAQRQNGSPDSLVRRPVLAIIGRREEENRRRLLNTEATTRSLTMARMGDSGRGVPLC